MRISAGFIISLFVLFSLCCHRHGEIILDQVADLPEYFSENYRFGRDIKSIEELNECILITGKIDTTTEVPPLRLAVINIDHKRIFLTLRKSTVTENGINERYSGNGYSLDLNFRENKVKNHSPIYEGYLTLEGDNSKSEYNIVGTTGYY
ncbi:MAG TPA: hypothetical protein VGI82_00645 [Chitinophagaceae bacterium]|jgi:hypothetical protein